MENEKRRSSIQIMGRLIGLVKPLAHIMTLAVILGIAGYLCAIFLTILAGQGLMYGINQTPVKTLFFSMGMIAVFRGILHYAEQYCNHYIAFKLLAIIRHNVFDALRKLCPAKLEGRDRGNLISIITTDIELLEVFYAHTISPVFIAIGTSIAMVLFLGNYHIYLGAFAAMAYVLVGIVIPLYNGKKGGSKGMAFRTAFGDLNSFVLDSLRGIDETIQYGQGNQRKSAMTQRSNELSSLQKDLSRMEAKQRGLTNLVVLCCSFGMLFLTIYLNRSQHLEFEGVMLCTIGMMSSFGPVIALSSLSNNLNQTLASGERVLSILEEQPMVEQVAGEAKEYIDFTGAQIEDVTFSYEEEMILKHCSIEMNPGQVIGIHGKSGSGKSTLLKLLMRFWDVSKGKITISDGDVREIPTKQLRRTQSYVTQETHLFHDSIANNIAVGKPGAQREEIIAAAKKASLHELIKSLPEGYDTKVGEMGETLSGGEKQRIGIARAFLHDAPFLLLDEPTSNLDALNEGMILKSLEESCKDKTVVLVSHRKSTMKLADVIYNMNCGRVS